MLMRVAPSPSAAQQHEKKLGLHVGVGAVFKLALRTRISSRLG
jgi:hypothetical protein